MYNVQNDRIWARNREEADKRDGVQQKRKFAEKVMVLSRRLTPLIILDEGTMDHRDEILPVTLKYGNEDFGDNWTVRRGWCQGTNACLNSRMVPIFHRQRSLAPKLTRFGMSLLWAKVKSKKTLIDELKRSVKRIRDSVVLDQSFV